MCCFFFFQAEDGIRDLTVTGVQTCALPIWIGARRVYNFRRTTQAAFDQMPMERAILPNRDLMFFALDFASDWGVACFGFLGDSRCQHCSSDRLKRFALPRVGLLVDVVIGK